VKLRWQAALLTVTKIISYCGLALVVGCGRSPEAGVETPSSDVQAVAKTKPKGQPQTAQLPENSTDSPRVANQRGIDPQEALAARDAFQVLITPGSEPAAWDAAQQKLAAMGAAASLVLIDGLRSSSDMEREIAATVCALAETIDAPLQTCLVQCLDDQSAFVRVNAAAALARFPEHQTPVMATLTDLLADSNPQLRRMAATNLSAFGPEASTALPQLTAVLADDDAEVVTPVIQLLGRIGPPAVEAVPQLQKIAFEQDGEVKQAAEQALLLIQSDSAEDAQPQK
jgi:HEAT repeat protein